MSFRLKVMLSVLLLALLAFDGASLVMMRKSTDLNLSRERARALGEHHALLLQVESQLGEGAGDPGARLGVAHSLVALRAAGSGTSMYWYRGEEPVVVGSPIPGKDAAALLQSGARGTAVVNLPDGQALLCAGPMGAANEGYSLITATSLAPLARMNDELVRAMVLASAVGSAILAALLLALLSGLMRPVSQLAKVTAAFEASEYGRRVKVVGRDELARLGGAFNRMAAKVQAQMGALSRSAEQKQRFADNLAHEMRTPVTAMRGYARTLMEQPMSEEDQHKALSYIAHESARLQAMSEALLQLSMARGAKLMMRKADVPALVRRAVQTAGPELIARQVSVRTDLRLDALDCDPALMESLLVNLIVNAARASDIGGTVVVEAGEEPVIRVVDRGRGMTAEQIERAAEPFYRTDKSRARRDGGAGLGLSLVQQIADAHGAKLIIHSAPGMGTAVTIEFTAPLQPGEDSETPKRV